MNHSITYYQPKNSSVNGYIVVDGQVKRANGRLDSPGSTVSAYGFSFTDKCSDEYSIYTECTLIDDDDVLFSLTYINSKGCSAGELNISARVDTQSTSINEFGENI